MKRLHWEEKDMLNKTKAITRIAKNFFIRDRDS